MSLFLPAIPAFAQDPSNTLMAKFTTENIRLDGIMDEPVWETADSISDFWQFFPSDSVKAKNFTATKILYNEHTIFVGIRAEVMGNNYVIPTLRRDFRGTIADNITLMFDTYQDGSNAFLFGMTPNGVQRESLVSDGGRVLNTTWDVKWQVVSRMFDDHYILEVAIPLSSLKFKEGSTSWNFQCYRWDLQSNEQSAWAKVPQNQQLSTLAFMGKLLFEQPLGKSRTPIAIIPYINGLSQKDFETNKGSNKLKVGGDAKVAIGNSLNLDITVNPDFSNVEVDAIFTNLTRFEVFLPERRQFFMDNSDLFGNFGSSLDARPFFSRRIGLARDNAGNLIENRILGGVRLSGKIGQDWRIGFLDVQTDEDTAGSIPSNNNMMLAVQRSVFSRSNVGFFFLNRESFKEYDFLSSNNQFNRVAGIDYNLASANNAWTGKFYLHKSFQPDDIKGNLSSQATITYNKRRIGFTNDWVYVDNEFRSDLGYIPRKGFFKSGNSFQLKFYPKKGIINTHSIQPMAIFYWNPELDFKRTDHDIRLTWNAEFKDQSAVSLLLANRYIFLTNGFDPTRTPGGIPLPGDTGYTFNQATATYQSGLAKKFTYSASSTVGQFYNGFVYSFDAEISLRFQPWVLVSMAASYDGIRLPDPYSDADLWLLNPRIDVTFSKSVFWSTQVQYSNQRENLGINSRLQWRFAPLSDLYIVYNDNYFTGDFSPRFRSINLKLTYWLNL
jgi:hypothetical protein